MDVGHEDGRLQTENQDAINVFFKSGSKFFDPTDAAHHEEETVTIPGIER